MEGIFFWLALVLFSLLSQALRKKPQDPRQIPGQVTRRVRVPVEEPAQARRVAVRTTGAPALPEARPMEAPKAAAPAAGAPAVEPVARGSRLVLDRTSVLNGVIFTEVLGRPRGLRPWRPHGWRQ